MGHPRLLSFRDGEEAFARLVAYGVPSRDGRRIVGRLREFLLHLPATDGIPSGFTNPPPGVAWARGGDGSVLLTAGREELSAGSVPGLAGAVERFLRRPSSLPCAGRTLPLGERTAVMGIVNVTPDSFSDGGLHASEDGAVARALALLDEGADLVDVGGESTRPGSEPVPPDVQARRVVPVVRRVLESRPGAILSVDTTSASVAAAALRAGAAVVNDTSALRDDPAMASVVRDGGAAVVLMHRRGLPRTMQEAPSYGHFLRELVEELEQSALRAVDGGIDPGRIVLDPGVGFGKRPADNLQAHLHLGDVVALGFPVLFGSSRKATLGLVDRLPPGERLHTSLASAVIAAWNGASIVRVHDVAPARRALDLVAAVRSGELP